MNAVPTPRIPPPVDPHTDIPSDLAASLRALHPHVPVGPGIDDAVLVHARRAAARRTLQRRLLLAAPLAAAAGLALAVCVAWPHSSRSGRVPPPHVAAPRSATDHTSDGVIDMRDALALAIRVRQGSPRPGDDQNRDGVVDARDIDALALLAVTIAPMKGGGA
jgi:hypothetical protein